MPEPGEKPDQQNRQRDPCQLSHFQDVVASYNTVSGVGFEGRPACRAAPVCKHGGLRTTPRAGRRRANRIGTRRRSYEFDRAGPAFWGRSARVSPAILDRPAGRNDGTTPSNRVPGRPAGRGRTVLCELYSSRPIHIMPRAENELSRWAKTGILGVFLTLLTSTQNPVIKEIRRAIAQGGLTRDGFCVTEGPRLLEEAVRSGCEIGFVLSAGGVLTPPGVHVTGITESLLSDMSATET